MIIFKEGKNIAAISRPDSATNIKSKNNNAGPPYFYIAIVF